jgi:hypothetical protein
MKDDPIVDEVHRVRRQLLEEVGGDLKKLMARWKAMEREDQDRVVTSIEQARQRSTPVTR